MDRSSSRSPVRRATARRTRAKLLCPAAVLALATLALALHPIFAEQRSPSVRIVNPAVVAGEIGTSLSAAGAEVRLVLSPLVVKASRSPSGARVIVGPTVFLACGRGRVNPVPRTVSAVFWWHLYE